MCEDGLTEGRWLALRGQDGYAVNVLGEESEGNSTEAAPVAR